MSYLAQTCHRQCVNLYLHACVDRATTVNSKLSFLAAGQVPGLKLKRQYPVNSSEQLSSSPRHNKMLNIMPLIQLLEALIVVGVLLWLVNRFIPMQASITSILNGVVVIAVVLWLLNVFGLFHSLSRIHVGS